MSEDIGASMPNAGPENLPSLPNRFKPGRFASAPVPAPVPHNPKPLDGETRKAHAVDPYAGIILPADAEAHADDAAPNDKETTADE